MLHDSLKSWITGSLINYLFIISSIFLKVLDDNKTLPSWFLIDMDNFWDSDKGRKKFCFPQLAFNEQALIYGHVELVTMQPCYSVANRKILDRTLTKNNYYQNSYDSPINLKQKFPLLDMSKVELQSIRKSSKLCNKSWASNWRSLVRQMTSFLGHEFSHSNSHLHGWF